MINLTSNLLTFVRYCGIGVINTLTCLLLMLLMDTFGMHYLLYTPIAYLISMGLSYRLNYTFTFRATHNTEQIKRFFIFNISNLCLIEAIEYTLIQAYYWPTSVAIILCMIGYIIIGFIGNLTMVFHQAKITTPYQKRPSHD